MNEKLLHNFFLLILLIAVSQSIYCQVSFTDVTDNVLNESGTSGVALAVTDMNDDGRDDIIRLNNASDLYVEYQSQDGTKFETLSFGSVTGGNQWSMCIGDIDNNGASEILSGGSYNGMTLMNSGMNGNVEMIGELPQSDNIFLQGSNFVDINNDGFLDIFGCHDDGASYIWENDGNGGFTVNTDWIDLSINGQNGEGASGNYGSVWADIDNDGDIDLYIAKCRQGVTDVTDHRRINKLYVNDGNGTFTEESIERGLDIEWQSWTADMQDINNDGFLDVFVTNHDHESQLLLNDGTGHFIELTQTGINVQGLAIQGVFRDFDNDGWVDVLVSGSDAQLFINNKDLTFTEIEFAAGGMHSFALGDLNSDGFVDVFGGYANGFNSPSSTKDKVWFNNGNDNNFLAVNLKGQLSNKDAIGARIEIFGEWGMQCREVRSGESYGIMNSTIQYFGLGQSASIDSIVVKWPSGISQVEYEAAINSKVTILEGGCLAASPSLVIEGNTTFCTGDSVKLNILEDYVSYQWSNGDTSSNITVYEPGVYSAIMKDEEGCTAFSEVVVVKVDPTLEPEIVLDGPDLFCDGDVSQLILEELDSSYPVIWSTGEISQSITITESGIYNVEVMGLCESFVSNDIEVFVYDYPEAPVAEGDSIKIGEVATITAEGNNIAWYENEADQAILATGNVYELNDLAESRSYYASERQGDPGITENVGMKNHAGSPYSGVGFNNNLLMFDAFEAFTLDSVKVYTDEPGIRKMLLVDNQSNELSSVFIDVPLGENYIYVGLEIPAGLDMSLTTDAETNIQNIGMPGPRLQRSSEDVEYPYIVENVVELKNSNFGEGYYYYFYDWKVSTDKSMCPSERTKVDVIVEDPNSLVEVEGHQVNIYPNPSRGILNIELNNSFSYPLQVSLFDQSGRLVNNQNQTDKLEILDFSGVESGLYILEILNEEKVYKQKVILLDK